MRPLLCTALACLAAAITFDARADEPPPDATDDGWFANQRGFAFQMMLGPGYRNLHDIHVLGADLEVAFGAQTKAGGFYGRLNLLLGRTPEGLFTTSLRGAATWEAPLGPFRLGLGAELGMLGYNRATTGNFDGAWGIGPRLHANWDFAEGDSYSVFLGLRTGVDFYDLGNDPVAVPDVTLQLGMRFF